MEIFWCKVHVIGQHSTVWTACVATHTITYLQSVFESWSQEWNCPPPPLHYTYFSSFYHFIIDANAQPLGSPKCHIGSFLDFSNHPSNVFFCHFVQRGPFHTVPYLIPIMHHPFATCNTHKAPFNLYLFYKYYPLCTTPQPHLPATCLLQHDSLIDGLTTLITRYTLKAPYT